MPNLGFDPAPGDVGGTDELARQFDQMSAALQNLATQLGQLNFSGWRGQAADSTRSLVLEDIAPSLKDAATIASQIRSGITSWSGQLLEFQSEADVLERRAGNAAADLDSVRSQHANAPGHAKALLASDLADAQSTADSVNAAAHELHERYLQAAETAGKDASGENDPVFIKATDEFNKVAGGAITPFQLVAGDAWVDLINRSGETIRDCDKEIGKVKKLPRASDERIEALKQLGIDFEDNAKKLDSRVLDSSLLPAKAQEFAANNPDLFRGAAILTSAMGILGDLGTEISPEDKGAMGNVDRGVAVVNGGVIAVDVAGGLDAAAAANVTLDWIPGVGEGVIVSTGAYLAGDWLYHHWTPAHDSMDAIADQPSNILETIKNGIIQGSFLGKL